MALLSRTRRLGRTAVQLGSKRRSPVSGWAFKNKTLGFIRQIERKKGRISPFFMPKKPSKQIEKALVGYTNALKFQIFN